MTEAYVAIAPPQELDLDELEHLVTRINEENLKRSGDISSVSSLIVAVSSVALFLTGTANRITVAGGTTVDAGGSVGTIDIAGTYIGQTSITTLGTVTAGTWHGTKVGLAYGGTNADLSATGGTSQYLKQASSGAAITVGTIPASDISSGAALTKTDDTNVTLTLTGSPTTALLASTLLTLGWTGTLSVARGGTNIASYAVGDLLYASGATTLSKLADVAVGSVLASGGVTTAPAWSSNPSLLMGSSTGLMTLIGVANVQTSSGGIGNAADTTDDTLFTYSLPLNAMSANGKSIRTAATGHFATNVNTKEVKMWFAGTAIADSGVLTLSNTDWVCTIEVTRIDSTHVSCVGRFTGSNVADVVTVTANLAVSDLTANASVIKVTGASTITGAANDVLGYMMKTWFEN